MKDGHWIFNRREPFGLRNIQNNFDPWRSGRAVSCFSVQIGARHIIISGWPTLLTGIRPIFGKA